MLSLLPAPHGSSRDFGGFFVVPMNALLQHRGHVLTMSAGRSIARDNFNQNLSILTMLGSLFPAHQGRSICNDDNDRFHSFVAVSMCLGNFQAQTQPKRI